MTTDGSKRMTPREVAHEMQSVLRLGVTHFGAICPTWCDTMTAAIAADRAVETEAERVYREALEAMGKPTHGGAICPSCHRTRGICDASAWCSGTKARAALARVAALRGGTHG